MTRLLLVASTTVFIFCGCQSAPTFGQAASSSPQPQNAGFFDGVLQGVSALWGGGLTVAVLPPVPAVNSGPPPVTLADVVSGVNALRAQVDSVQTRVDAVESRSGKLDRRAGQSRLLVLGLVGLNGIVLLVLLLVALGVIGRPPLLADGEKAKLLELRAVRKRQAELTAAIGELQAFAMQATADREQFTALLSVAADELKRLEAETTTASEPART
jgi:hypothetical protein